jgi:small subunit ribosomal protein S18
MSENTKSGGKFEPRPRREGDAPAAAAGPREGAKRQRPGKISASGKLYIDYKETETLRRLTGANGKIQGRKRTGADALEQRMIAQAIKRARYMGLVAYQTTAS